MMNHHIYDCREWYSCIPTSAIEAIESGKAILKPNKVGAKLIYLNEDEGIPYHYYCVQSKRKPKPALRPPPPPPPIQINTNPFPAINNEIDTEAIRNDILQELENVSTNILESDQCNINVLDTYDDILNQLDQCTRAVSEFPESQEADFQSILENYSPELPYFPQSQPVNFQSPKTTETISNLPLKRYSTEVSKNIPLKRKNSMMSNDIDYDLEPPQQKIKIQVRCSEAGHRFNCEMNLQIPSPTTSIESMSEISDAGSTTSSNGSPGGLNNSMPQPKIKPRHFDFTKLEIGKYTHEIQSNLCNRPSLVRRLKVIFTLERLVYEYEVLPFEKDSDGNHKTISVEVPFHTITAMQCSGQTVIIKVDTFPGMFGGIRTQQAALKTCIYEKNNHIDITGGQLKLSPIHKLTLKRRGAADLLRVYLSNYDPIFQKKLRIGIPDPNETMLLKEPTDAMYLISKTCQSGEFNAIIKRNLLQRHEMSEIRFLPNNCFNRVWESTIKAEVKEQCNHPFMLLERYNIKESDARQDSCLLAAIRRLEVSLIEVFLNEDVACPQCDFKMPIYYCVPGIKKCGNMMCGIDVYYSWCNNRLYNDEIRPERHCNLCNLCVSSEATHCLSCQKCYVMRQFSSRYHKCR